MPAAHTSTASVEVTPPLKPKGSLNSPTSPSSGDYATPRNYDETDAVHLKPMDYVLKTGKSKFYRKSMDDLDKVTDDDLDSVDDTIVTDTGSQSSTETTATIPAKDAAIDPRP